MPSYDELIFFLHLRKIIIFAYKTLFRLKNYANFRFFLNDLFFQKCVYINNMFFLLVKWNRLALPKWIKSRPFCSCILIYFVSQEKKIISVYVTCSKLRKYCKSLLIIFRRLYFLDLVRHNKLLCLKLIVKYIDEHMKNYMHVF